MEKVLTLKEFVETKDIIKKAPELSNECYYERNLIQFN